LKVELSWQVDRINDYPSVSEKISQCSSVVDIRAAIDGTFVIDTQDRVD